MRAEEDRDGVDDRDGLDAAALTAALPGRPLRHYPALLSTEADALAWARAGAPHGAVVAAGYQAAPRGRAGFPWQLQQPPDFGFSVVLRPALPAEREGWLYAVAVSAVTDVLDPSALIRWPDEVHLDGARVAGAAVYAALDGARVDWSVTTVLVTGPLGPPAELIARLVGALEHRLAADPDALLADYSPRCVTLGARVRARLIPLGATGPHILGTAVDVDRNGALVIATETGRRVTVAPQHLGLLDDLPADGAESVDPG